MHLSFGLMSCMKAIAGEGSYGSGGVVDSVARSWLGERRKLRRNLLHFLYGFWGDFA